MIRYIIRLAMNILCLLPAMTAAAAADMSADSLMRQLYEVLSNRDSYTQIKEDRLRHLRLAADATTDMHARFDSLGRLMDEYYPFNSDSAYAISVERERIARQLGDSVLLINARMNRANVYNATAMYKETLELMDSIPGESVPDYLRPYYFYIKRTVYGRLADFAAFEPERRHYQHLTNLYRDSLLTVNDPSSLPYAIIKADKLNTSGHPAEALALLDRFLAENEVSEHDRAICAWSQSESHLLLGDNDSRKKDLIISSIADLKSSVREYVSLRHLALLLYTEGDLEKAYELMSVAVDDAAKCNARQRIVELSAFYPMINDIYIEKIQSQKKSLSRTIVIITVMTTILLALLIYTRKQMRKVAEARKELQEAYGQLNDLNLELQESNKKLHEANRDILEISEMKEVYIGRYMDQCLAYIDKLDSYRKSAAKLLNSGKAEELKKTLKSAAPIDNELKAFYDQFDKTFLSLFPSFVEEFNRLLAPAEAIIPKKEGTLTTELRIFALIRLGITDSDRIAKFLRYSLTTIYNYRTKVRNKARGDRNLLEQEVLGIGRG